MTMPTRLNPYLNFTNNAREAMEFYHSIFGGELRVSTFAEFGGAPEGLQGDNIMHAMLESPNGFVLMGSDSPGSAGTENGSSAGGGNVTISLSGEDAEELRGYWEKLSDGGTVTMPLERQMWGDDFGMCVDRFGTSWMVDIVNMSNVGS